MINDLEDFFKLLELAKGKQKAHKEIIPFLWTEGGTGITNFSKEKLDLYQRSIRIYKRIGGKKDFRILFWPVCGVGGYLDNTMIEKYFSFHCLSGFNGDGLDGFWNIFDKLREKESKKCK